VSANLHLIRCVSFSYDSLLILPAQWLSTSDIAVLSTVGSVVTFDARAKHGVQVHVLESSIDGVGGEKTFLWSSKEELRLLSRVAYCCSVPCDTDRNE